MSLQENLKLLDALKKIHLDVGKNSFTPEADIEHFHPEERELLFRYGSWMKALVDGSIEPYTAAQEQFIKTAKGLSSPITEFEKVWIKYQRRIKWEEEEGIYFSGAPIRVCRSCGQAHRGDCIRSDAQRRPSHLNEFYQL